jgi:hypothetical protein
LIDAQGGLVEGEQDDGAALIIAWIFPFESGGNGGKRGLGLLGSDSRLQSANNGDPAEATVIFVLFGQTGENIVAHADGNPKNIGAAEGDGAFEVRRCNADNRVGSSIQRDRLADRIRVGPEVASPEAIAQNDYGVGARLFVLVAQKSAAAIRFHAENIEIVRAGEHRVQLLGLGASAPVHREGEGDRGKTGEDRVLVAVVFVVGEGCAGKLKVGVGVDGLVVAGKQFDQLGRFLHGKRMKKNSVDDGEDSGVGANTESEREYGNEGKTGALAEEARTAPEILQKSFKHGYPSGHAIH